MKHCSNGQSGLKRHKGVYPGLFIPRHGRGHNFFAKQMLLNKGSISKVVNSRHDCVKMFKYFFLPSPVPRSAATLH